MAGEVLAASGDTAADRVFGQPGMNWNASRHDATGVDAANGVAVDRASNPNRVWVVDWLNSRVLGWANSASYANGDPAIVVLGQPDFTTTTCNTGGITANSLCKPSGIAADAHGNVYVADEINHRVLEYDAPISSSAPASRVFGQPDFTTGNCNGLGLGRGTLCSPSGIAIDDAGNVYVADWDNHRVVEYNTPLTTDLLADRVYGQPDFTSGDCNTGGIGPATLCHPADVGVTRDGTQVFVADFINNRVLLYGNALSGDTTADRVYGRPDFTSTRCDLVGTANTNLCAPVSLGVDDAGNLYVADNTNRVLQYNGGASGDTVADRVYGQTDLSGTGCNAGGLSASSLCNPNGIAFDGAGNLFISDFDNHRVLEYDAPNGSGPGPGSDTTPEAFSFTPQSGVARSTMIESDIVAVQGIDASAPISVSGGEYRLYTGAAAGAWTSAAGSVAPGLSVQVRQTSAPAPSTATTTSLTIGGVTGSFTSTTAGADTTPAPYAFAAQTGVALSTVTASDIVAIQGIDADAPISVSGGEYRLYTGSAPGAWISAAGTIAPGQSVQVRQTSASTPSTSTVTDLTIGGVVGRFTTTTAAPPAAPDTTPDAYSFTPQNNVPLSTLVSSDTVTVHGMDADAPISVSGGEYRIFAGSAPGAWTRAAATVAPGQSVQVRQTSASTVSTPTHTDLTIGGVTGRFTTTTANAATGGGPATGPGAAAAPSGGGALSPSTLGALLLGAFALASSRRRRGWQ